uniref:Uncharacterized protein n=1 Tax=Siphoviridae sp. ct2ZW1 TaxID=2825316 RepID=A0A8S5QA22_9CAUD|nr:MAG TPA: hypothetical protein [Siphoviridae sp. ct2ZW1]
MLRRVTKFAQNNISHHSQTKSPKGGVGRGINNFNYGRNIQVFQ